MNQCCRCDSHALQPPLRLAERVHGVFKLPTKDTERDGVTMLAFQLMSERLRENSFWRPYIDSLPVYTLPVGSAATVGGAGSDSTLDVRRRLRGERGAQGHSSAA